MKICKLLIIIAVLVTAVRSARAQALPEVIKHENLVYPPLARQARIGGSVRLRITTDGRAVSDVPVLEGHALLVQAATNNVRTWKFADHVPGTFDVTFNFVTLRERTTFLQEPGVVDIAVLPPQYNENSNDRLAYTLPVTWDLELKTATDDIKAPLTLWTYGQWLRGYTVGVRGQERELGSAHIDGEMLGFDARLDDSHGQRLNFSLIGKKVGDEIQGIFLDAWGTSGTWTAIPAKPPDPTCATASAGAVENIMQIPEITQHKQPDYPSIPWEAHIEGQVQMRVSADSYCVGKITADSTEPLLAQAAEANVRTWWFDNHKPGSFNVTFNYRLLKAGVSFLEKPGIVEISEIPATLGAGPRSGLWNSGGYVPETWEAQLTSLHGHVGLTLRFPYGCCEEGNVADSTGRKVEVTQGHAFDELGFSIIVKLNKNQPVKVLLVGIRQGGDRIKGVFLDESGFRGKWSARVVSHGPPGVQL